MDEAIFKLRSRGHIVETEKAVLRPTPEYPVGELHTPVDGTLRTNAEIVALAR